MYTTSLLLKDLTHLKESSCVKSLKRWIMYSRVSPPVSFVGLFTCLLWSIRTQRTLSVEPTNCVFLNRTLSLDVN